MVFEDKSRSSAWIFLGVVFIIAVLIIMLARQDNYVSQDDLNSLGLFNSSNTILQPSVSPAKVDVFFCPEDNCANQLIREIDSSKESIYIAIYSFTHDGIADSVIRARNRGVEVKVIFDYDQSANKSSDDERIFAAGIPIARRNGSGYMHNKFTVIDGNFVATGSFNYSQNADERNDENLVFIESVDIASKFKSDFDYLWGISDKA
ncbi:MAG: phospholipase D-like domain-containing protein [archaeon]